MTQNGRRRDDAVAVAAWRKRKRWEDVGLRWKRSGTLWRDVLKTRVASEAKTEKNEASRSRGAGPAACVLVKLVG